MEEDEVNRELARGLVADRLRFSSYYRIATEREAIAMDTVLLARHTLALARNCPREALAVADHLEFERDPVMDVFRDHRDAVRQSAAFSALSSEERQRIEREAFSIQFACEN